MKLKTLIFVYVALSFAWLSLAQSIQERHVLVDRILQSDVAKLWGCPNRQTAPRLSDGGTIESSKIDVDLDLEYRRKGHYWYSTYTAHSESEFTLNPKMCKGKAFQFTLPSGGGMISDFDISVDGQPVTDYKKDGSMVEFQIPLAGAQTIVVHYSSQGSDEWWYNFENEDGGPKNLQLTLTTNFGDFDFPDGSISPTSLTKTDGEGWTLSWSYSHLLSGGQVGLNLPKKNNPGPVLIDICRYGPLGLFLFFGALTVCSIDFGKLAHPMNYILFGAGFFSFHLLLIYMGDVLPLAAAFTISAVAATLINWSYGSKVFGPKFARNRLLPSLLLYLVLFSSAFLVEGFKGLPIVILMVISLFLLMQFTAKVDWDQVERKRESRSDSNPIISLSTDGHLES
jgi:Inner membrane protein CreD